MKEHILRQLTNDLRDIAIEFHATQQLRDRISHRLLLAFHDDVEWYRQYEALAHVKPQVGIEVVPPTGRPDDNLSVRKSWGGV